MNIEEQVNNRLVREHTYNLMYYYFSNCKAGDIKNRDSFLKYLETIINNDINIKAAKKEALKQFDLLQEEDFNYLIKR